MELKLCFFFLLLPVIHAQFVRRWLINVPTKIPAVENSCVVIPCSFTFPRRSAMLDNEVTIGFWKTDNKVIATTSPYWDLPPEYERRTYFLGNLRALNCTMQLDGVRKTDVGPYHFRFEMGRKRYSFVNNPVNIDVISTPPPPSMTVRRRDKVSVACSVTHSCPLSPPKFAWSQNENIMHLSHRLKTWQWMTTSILIFKPGPAATNKTLSCTVLYSGGKKATNSVIVRM